MPPVSGSDLYFSLVAERQCGECKVCCKYLSINAPELKKPADILCENCVNHSGCSIYQTRPSVCRTWHCLWRRIDAMPPNLRPDKSGVLFSLKVSYEPRYVFENAYIVCMTLSDPSAFDTPAVSAALDMFIKEGSYPVWLSHEGSKSLTYPAAELADAIANPATTQSTHLVAVGKVWLDHYHAMQEPLRNRQAMFGREFLRDGPPLT